MKRVPALATALILAASGLAVALPGVASAAPRTIPLATSPVAGDVVVASPGRAAWSDESGDGSRVWSRTLSGSGEGLTAGAASLVSAHSTGYGVSLSGRRTAFFAARGGDDDPQTLKVATGSVITTIATDPTFDRSTGPPDAGMSGTRLLFRIAAGWRLRDLATATTTAPTWLNTAVVDARLWGNYVAYLNSDGSVWRRNLTTTAPAVRLAPATATGGASAFGRVFAWGDYVAWEYATCVPDTGDCGEVHHAYRDARTLVAAVTLASGPEIVSAGSDGFVLRTMSEDYSSSTYAVRNPATATDTPITGAANADNSDVSVDSGVAAWVSQTGVPTIAALPSRAANPPRFLGNPIMKVSRPTATTWAWTGEMVTSAAMTSCQVVIRKATTVVRTLTCDTANAALGDAVVSWNGRNSTGTAVTPGAYTWTLVGSNGDGALRNADGSTSPVAGSIALTARPAVTRQPAARTVRANYTAVFTATASGAPAPTVQWQVSANAGRTFANLAGKRSTTLSFKTTRRQTGYRYRAVFTNLAGAATSSMARLTVR